MAKDDKNMVSDEDYLDKLLNSVINESDEEDLLGDLNNKLNGSISEEDTIDIFQDVESDADDFSDSFFDESELDELLKSEIENIDEENDNVVKEAADNTDGDEDMKELFDMLNGEFDELEQPEVPEVSQAESASGNNGEMPLSGEDLEFANMLESIAMGESIEDEAGDTTAENSPEDAAPELEGLEETNILGPASDTDVPKTSEDTIVDKKQGFFAKLFGRKRTVETPKAKDENEEIIRQMEEGGFEEFDEFDELEQLEDRTQSKKKKNKKAKAKEKKEKKAQKAKDKKKDKKSKEKQPKEKKQESPDEIIHIPVPVYILAVTIAAGVGLISTFGSSIFNYNSKMDDAVRAFVNRDYDKAYELISGLEIKNKDNDFYNQVVTVMYVQKQYNSYNHYRFTGEYRKALNALIKGIERYDKYHQDAIDLGITSDMDYIYNNITQALKYDYGLSVKEAKEIADIPDSVEYISRISDVADKCISVIEGNIAKEESMTATEE